MHKSRLLFLITINIVYVATLQAGTPLFPNSVVSNDIDFILDTDADAFKSMAFLRGENKEMPDSRNDKLFDTNTFVFEATFSDAKKVQIWCHSSFETQAAAQAYAEKLCPRLGKLPEVQRNMLDHVIIHKGNATAFAETEGHFFVLYSDNMDARISTHDLEETVFHESVHASIQDTYKNNAEWKNAQTLDPSYITDYAKSLPNLEDMPETALFAYTLIAHPRRLSPEIEAWFTTNIPNRIAFFRKIYSSGNTEIQETKTDGITFYPNPAKSEVKFNLNQVETVREIKIYNVSGVLQLTQIAISGENSINMSNLKNGFYIISVPEFRNSAIIKH